MVVMDYDPAEYGNLWASAYDDEHDWIDPSLAVDFLSRLAQGRRVLELGIGTGRLALPLAQKGVRVVGLDSSEAMVERMRSKPGGKEIEVILGDMASSDLAGPYGLIFVAFNTIFGLLDQQRQLDCFANVRRALAPGGHFVLECFVPDLQRFQSGNQTVRMLPTSTAERLRLNASLHHPDHQRIDTHVIVIEDGHVDVLPVFLRYIWPSELDLMAQITGFELAARYGGWSEEPFTAGSTSHVSVYQMGRAS